MANKYYDKVKVKCVVCEHEQENEMQFGENEKYLDDFYIKCKKCDNWEEGGLPIQSFELLEFIERVEI